MQIRSGKSDPIRTRRGDISVTTEADSVRFILVSGKPIGEPVAWYGPIVMNTQKELEIAFEEFRTARSSNTNDIKAAVKMYIAHLPMLAAGRIIPW